MYISKLEIKNFRNFKNKVVEFNDGVNVIIGHNNAGKTNLIKALSIVLDSTNSRRLNLDDFNKNLTLTELKAHSPKITIVLTIAKGGNQEETDVENEADDLVTIGNWLTKLDSSYEALLTYEFFLPEKIEERYQQEIQAIEDTDNNALETAWKIINYDYLRFFTYKIWGGDINNQTAADSESLQKFDFQFLDAIRDVERDMLTGRNSLLRDVLDFFLDYGIKTGDGTSEEKKALIKLNREDFSNKAQILLTSFENRLKEGKKQILSYAKETGASFNKATPNFDGIISESDIFSALRLIVEYETGIKIPATHNGLGYNNLIFMSLILAKMQVNSDGEYMENNAKVFATLAIEEPEAHLHPAMQFKFLKFLRENKKEKKVRQIFVTTHSTHITSAVSLDEIICLHRESNETSIGYLGQVFPEDDNDKSKKYVQRFLDATKSDMLFAQRVILVEGIAEQLLLPTFAKYYDIESKEAFNLNQETYPSDEVYKSKALEDNHVSIINVGGRYFNYFLYLFDKNISKAVPKLTACITDRDPERKEKAESSYKKCYPFEYNQNTTTHDYQDNPSSLLTSYSSHPNIRFFSQAIDRGKTLEYDLVIYNPSLDLLVTDSMSNRDEIIELMSWIDDNTKSVTDFHTKLPKGSAAKPNQKNIDIASSIQACSWALDDDKKKAIIAARYLNSVGKGANALELMYALEENLKKKGTTEYKDFVVPDYIKHAIDWVCQ